MSDFESLERRYTATDTQDLLDIVEGRRLGYSEPAVLAAQSVLRARGVSFREVPYDVLAERTARIPDPASLNFERILGIGGAPRPKHAELRIRALVFIGLGIAGAVIWSGGYRSRDLDLSTVLMVLGAGVIGLIRPNALREVWFRRGAKGKMTMPSPLPRADEPSVSGSSSWSIRHTVRIFLRIGLGVAVVYTFIAALGLIMGDRWR
jgi:hypothetical protein